MTNIIINPKELAKRTKESTRPVSLRIKERTWLGFEQLAKETGTTANSLIGELADYYIESLGQDLNLSDDAVNLNKFKSAVEKEVRKLCRWTIDDAVLDVNMVYAKNRSMNNADADDTYLEALKRMFKTYSISPENGKEYANYQFEFCTNIGDDITVYPTLEQKASYNTGAFDPQSAFQDMLCVPIEKAPDVIHLLKFVNAAAEKNKIHIEFDIDIIDNIVKSINSYKYGYHEEVIDGHRKQYYNDGERRSMLNRIAQIIIRAAENA